MKILHRVLLCSGLAFLAYLIWSVGPEELWSQLMALGWGVVPLVLIEGLANLAHTVGWRHCINEASHSVPLLRLFRMAMAGFSINYLTPSASLGGEATKAALLAPGIKGPQAVSSVLMDKLCLGLAHLLLVFFGAFFLLWRVTLPSRLWLAMGVCSLLLTSGIVVFLVLQKQGKLGGFLRWFVARKLGGRHLESLEQSISRVDAALIMFYREHRRRLVLSVGWHFIGHAAAIFQAWLFLVLLNQPMPLSAVLVAAFLGLWIDLLTFAIPMNLGALEGARILAFKAIGFQAPLGMTFGVAIRIAQLFWAIFGLLTYALMTFSCPALKRKAQPEKLSGVPLSN